MDRGDSKKPAAIGEEGEVNISDAEKVKEQCPK